MTLHVDPLETIWLVVNLATLILTLKAADEARADLVLVSIEPPDDSHLARLVISRGNLRREVLRVIIQLLLISIVIPGLFTDRPVVITAPVLALLLIPVILFTSTFFDARDRRALVDILLAQVKTDRAAQALEASVQENIALTKEGIEHAKIAGDKADAAYHEANSVNVKIEHLNERLIEQDK